MKKNLLIYWVSRTFVEVIKPLIPQLSDDFNIVILLYSHSSPSGLVNELKVLENAGYIKSYSITPEHNKMLAFHLFMKSKLNELVKQKFDFWLTSGEMQVGERYIYECVLPKECISVCMWQNITYLFMYNPTYVKRLLSDNEIPQFSKTRETPSSSSLSFIKRVLKKLKESEYVFLVFYNQIKLRVHKFKRYCLFVVDRIILPIILVKKVFRLGPYDQLTQLSSGRSNALIFFDEIESKAHKKLLATPDIYTASYPTSGNCSCKLKVKDNRIILSPLSGFEGRDNISKEILSMFCREFQTVLTETNSNKIHLRLHPNETGEWPNQLLTYLTEHDIDAKIVDSHRPISEVMCNYIAMAGYASAAMRDARACCDYAIIIGFVSVSSFQFKDPKQVFAGSEGIGWIEKDGTFQQDIFESKEYIPPKRMSVPEILSSLI